MVILVGAIRLMPRGDHIGDRRTDLSPKNQYSHFMFVADPPVQALPTGPLVPLPALRGAIGVFDSGVGGLSVLRAIRAQLPHEHLVYVADSGHAPYGDKPTSHIVERTLTVGLWLAQQGVRAITVACNTATLAAVEALRERTHLPVVAIEPAIKPAAALTQSGVVGVLATQQTIQSEGVARLVARFGQGVRFVLQACPGWVEQVEQGNLEGPETLAMVARDTQALKDAGADVWVLGCTHYPFLHKALGLCAGPSVQLLDPAQAVARELVRRLPPLEGTPLPATTYFTSGDLQQARRVIAHLAQVC